MKTHGQIFIENNQCKENIYCRNWCLCRTSLGTGRVSSSPSWSSWAWWAWSSSQSRSSHRLLGHPESQAQEWSWANSIKELSNPTKFSLIGQPVNRNLLMLFLDICYSQTVQNGLSQVETNNSNSVWYLSNIITDSKLVFEDENGFLSSYDVDSGTKSQIYELSSLVSRGKTRARAGKPIEVYCCFKSQK